MLDKLWIRDGALLLLRITAGLVLGTHAYQIGIGGGFTAASHLFAQWGIAEPRVAIVILASVFSVAGLGLLIGILTPLMAMLGFAGEAYYLYYAIVGGGFPLTAAPTMLVIVLMVVLFSITLLGGGRASTDEVLHRRRGR